MKYVIVFCFSMLACSSKSTHFVESNIEFKDDKELKKLYKKLFIRYKSGNKKATCDMGKLELGWLLTAGGNHNSELLGSLFDTAGVICTGNPFVDTTCITNYYEHLELLFNECKKGDSIAGEWGLLFINWQGRLKVKWGKEFFETAGKLLKSPYKNETIVVLIGALRHTLEILDKNPVGARLSRFIRYLGFPCAEYAGKWTDLGPENPGTYLPQSKSCLPNCKKTNLKNSFISFAKRRKLVLKHCSYKDFAFSSSKGMKYIAFDNHLLFETTGFFRKLIDEIEKSESKLLFSNKKWISKTINKFKGFVFHLSFPVLSDTEKGFIAIPLSKAAETLPVNLWFVSFDPAGNLQYGSRTKYNGYTGKISNDELPGKPVNKSLKGLIKLKKQTPPLLIIDEKTPAANFLKILREMYDSGLKKADFLLRTNHSLLRSYSVGIIDKIPEKSHLLLKFGPEILTLTSTKGFLLTKPFLGTSPYDFSGLRQRLEKIKWKYNKKVHVVLKLFKGVSWGTISRLLGYLSKNSSNRIMYRHIDILIEKNMKNIKNEVK
jgi:hypothetical protein